MFCLTILSIVGLVRSQDEQSSLLQTSSRDNALTTRAKNAVEIEDEDALEDSLGGKKCTKWLADEAVANAHAQLKTFRVSMKELGFEKRMKDTVKIGAYCPAMLAEEAVTDNAVINSLLFLDTPCADRATALFECIKGFEDTCKYIGDATKKMMSTLRKRMNQEMNSIRVHGARIPQGLRTETTQYVDDELRSIQAEVDRGMYQMQDCSIYPIICNIHSSGTSYAECGRVKLQESFTTLMNLSTSTIQRLSETESNGKNHLQRFIEALKIEDENASPEDSFGASLIQQNMTQEKAALVQDIENK